MGERCSQALEEHPKKVYDGMDAELQGDKFIRIIVEEIKYDLAIDATRAYYDLKITGPGAGSFQSKIHQFCSEQANHQKQTALKDLEAQFTEVAQMVAGKYTIAAIVELAKTYDNYGDTIKNSYVPSFLDEDQVRTLQDAT